MAVGDLVAEGERQVKMQLYPGHGYITGNYYNSVHGDIIASRHGMIHDSDAVYGPWLEGVGSRNETTRFKGYAMFRNAYQHLEKIATAVMNRRAKQFAQRMGGAG